MPKIIKFKKPGESITIGSQRFDQNNITPEVHKALVEMNPALAELFEEIDQKIESVPEGEQKTTAKPAKPKPE